MEQIARLQQMIDESGSIVFFGGAGVSTESGIPDFRSTDGLFRQKYAYAPELLLSHGFFMAQTAAFYDFYRHKMLYLSALPNAAHRKLAQLEKTGKLQAVITQNIDGLHQKAGSKNVLELHGSVWRNFCMDCGKAYDVDFVLRSEGVPRCTCGGIVKPDVVLYGEMLNENTMQAALRFLAQADMLIIGGTSLAVYPAAGLIGAYPGKRLVLLNRDVTAYDERAALCVKGKIGEILAQIKVAV